MEEFNFEMEDTKETKTRVKKAVEKKAKATESMEDAWERIFLMKNSATDQERLREVKEAWELGVLIRKDTSKKFSKSEAMKMYTELSEHLREQRIADMVAKTPNNYFLVRDSVQLKHIVNLLKKEKLTALDTETTGLDTYRDTIVGMSITLPIADLHVYIPNGHDNQEQLSLEYVLRELDFYLTNPEYEKVLHNAKYDYHMFARHGVKLEGIVMDTMIAMKLLNENETSYRLKDLANKYATHIGVDPEEEAYTFDTLFGKNCKFNTVPLDIALVYACKDTHLTYKFYKFLRSQLDKPELEGVRSLHDTVENPLIPIVADMERVGFLPDLEYTKEYSKELHTQIDEIGEELKEVFGDINFSSPLQLQKVLYDDLGLKDSSGKRSTDKKTLESLANDNEHVAKILEHRKLNKLAGTYVDVIEGLLRPDGRVHGSFNQVEAGTGRFSSTNPNLQNLSNKARLMYVAPEGKIIVGADLSAIEPRVLAHISDDNDLRKPYLDGIDLYQILASRTFKVPFEDCGDGSKYRKMMKMGLLSCMYGTSMFTLSQQLKITIEEAEKFISDFYEAFPKVKEFVEGVWEDVKKCEYVETLYGRKRRFPKHKQQATEFDAVVKKICVITCTETVPQKLFEEKKVPFELKRKYWDLRKPVGRVRRQAVNAIIQGSAADVLKKGMLNMAKLCERKGSEWKLLACVHDELLVEVPETITLEEVEEIQEAMTSAVKLTVPLKTDAELMKRWGEGTGKGEYFNEVQN